MNYLHLLDGKQVDRADLLDELFENYRSFSFCSTPDDTRREVDQMECEAKSSPRRTCWFGAHIIVATDTPANRERFNVAVEC